MSNPARLDVEQADTVKVIYEDQELMLPVVEGSEGERGIDISKLRGQSGLVTLDEGYVNTGSTRSGITYLDGEKGILRYRGYPIEQLAAKSDFIETAYLDPRRIADGKRSGGFSCWHSRAYHDSRGYEIVLQRFPT